MTTTLDGSGLEIASLAQVAESWTEQVVLDPAGVERARRARARVMQALEQGERVYGLTTGLGSRANETLTGAEAAAFSMQTLRGRGQAVGEPLAVRQVRAAMAVRLNTLLKGAAGADLSLLYLLRSCLNCGLTPVIGSIGSIGASDLCQGAVLGLALCGQGRMSTPEDGELDALHAMRKNDLNALVPGPRDGLALANHSSFSAAAMALAVHEASHLVAAVQATTALTMDAFVANTASLDPVIDTLRPQPGQAEAAAQLRQLLTGSGIMDDANARRLQDPLSIRNASQVHGAVLATLGFAVNAAQAEINGASDNPLVDLHADRIVSGGAYYTPLLTIAAEAMSQAIWQMACAQLSRITRLLAERFTGLPQYLAASGSNSNGFAPVLKTAEALVAELGHAAMPVPVWPSVNADGVEDIQSNAPAAIKGLARVVSLAQRLCAIELLVACQGFEMRQQLSAGEVRPAPRSVALVDRVRAVAAPLDTDRPMGAEIETLAQLISCGKLGVTD